MSWKVAEAKQRLSELIRLAEKRPQVITNRDTPVAAIVSSSDYAEYMELREKDRHTFGDVVRDLAEAARDEGYELPASRRTDRPNPLDAKQKKRRASR
jgi:prevent-host-death family protein